MRNIIRLAVICLALTMVFIGLPAAAQSKYPDKPITYIICFNPGGESDLTARLQQKYLEEALGVKVVISYKIGGGGATGWSELVRARPDGYTIAGCNIPHTILQPLQRGDAGYKTEQLKRVYCFQSTPNALLVRKDSPFKTLKDFVEYGKKYPEVLTVGGSASWSANHLGHIQLEQAAGIKMTYIPFSGSGSAVPALLGGHVSALMSYTTMAAQYRDQMRILAVATPQRSPLFPDVPTFRELGYNVVEGAYRGVSVPPGTPDEIVKILADAFEKVNKNPEFIAKMHEMAFELENMGPKAYTDFVADRTVYYTKVLKDLGEIK